VNKAKKKVQDEVPRPSGRSVREPEQCKAPKGLRSPSLSDLLTPPAMEMICTRSTAPLAQRLAEHLTTSRQDEG
jgi:hypothetical protein